MLLSSSIHGSVSSIIVYVLLGCVLISCCSVILEIVIVVGCLFPIVMLILRV